ncbi:TPA: polyprenyl synthetase family protein [Streptococcus equi subsp. zooepidemicus]|nr:polyprenyl synthetase family protein [Streptococcus equi subsp. zooepidemicus]HEL0429538.1 polyprenyl synthetase family protein [Streptococcus equi subsp. zooepidemicus]HEL0431615.1 polyprenyl synthetase family protein [Streptococcus equi subsp. zooepidemicus]HEL0435772.1 polyprenyl synthetase family protein [Streptococcus equi subsp. zooepidemicus]HEL0439911.1 polyprenyl synthetase family protein [Streptococcus equi subsp. zooepidemicus]
MDKLTRINATIHQYYDRQSTVSADLEEAILYSVDGGGKRLRPLMLLELLEGFGLALTDAHYAIAAAIEMIHTGSLIHDDLPAMDNDDYRRGRLTSHKQFDEATAILAGDSLFLDPFALIAGADLPADLLVQLIQQFSLASGTFGMVGGQLLDMKGEQQLLDIQELSDIHANKTGKLLTLPFVAAGIIAEQSADVLSCLWEAGRLVGQAFQIRDDILDVTASFDELGKTPKKDLAVEKSTYPSLLGLERSRAILEESLSQALAIFSRLEKKEGFEPQAIIKRIEVLRLNG